MKKSATAGKSELTFEQALARLEEIVSRLEAGEEGLEEAIALFEEGRRLSDLCQERLATAQQQIEKLVEKGGASAGSGQAASPLDSQDAPPRAEPRGGRPAVQTEE